MEGMHANVWICARTQVVGTTGSGARSMHMHVYVLMHNAVARAATGEGRMVSGLGMEKRTERGRTRIVDECGDFEWWAHPTCAFQPQNS